MTSRTVRRTLLVCTIVAVSACSSDTVSGPEGGDLRGNEPEPRSPILFVHGWSSSGAIWGTMIDRFIAEGYSPGELFNWSYDTSKSNVTTALALKAKVDEIRATTGAGRVDIVTHSMGSLSARYYIRDLGGDVAVDEFVSLGGPNHGTNTALLCNQASCIEMRPNSSFLNGLNETDETPGKTVRYATFWSACDGVINPQKSTILSGASNTQTACIDHSGLYQDAEVFASVLSFVK